GSYTLDNTRNVQNLFMIYYTLLCLIRPKSKQHPINRWVHVLVWQKCIYLIRIITSGMTVCYHMFNYITIIFDTEKKKRFNFFAYYCRLYTNNYTITIARTYSLSLDPLMLFS